MGASSIITLQAKELAWSLQGTNTQGFWDTAGGHTPWSHPAQGWRGRRPGLYTPIPTSHSLAEGCCPMRLLSISSPSTLTCAAHKPNGLSCQE